MRYLILWDSPGTVGRVIFSLKFTPFNFSFNGFRMRTCYARPRIVYILSREDRLILRKESPAKFFFRGGEASVGGLLIPCYFSNNLAWPFFLP